MKKATLLLLIAAQINTIHVRGQVAFGTKDSVNINNINATVLVHGDMFWDPQLQIPASEFPAGSGKHINFVSALWMGGYDGGGQLHTAAQTYRQDGNDYWPGPLDSHDTATYATSHAWAKIWKVNRTDIQSFLSLPTHTTSNTPADILTWPGKGNVNAQGNAGVPLTVTENMAPFVDLNTNGIYEPLLGEYPDIKGDQTLWWVFNDNGASHGQSNGKPLGVEIRAMAFGFKRNTIIDNVIYLDYTIVNKSGNNYNNFRMGLFDDVDLGYYLDDFVGFDSAHRMGIAYNGTNDDGGAAGHPYNSYGTNPPIVGISLVVLPGDAGTSYVPAGSFITFNNDASDYGNPNNDTHFNNYLRAMNKVGTHYTNTYTSPGVPCLSQGTGPATNYMYTGDPSDNTGWSECNCSNNPGDRRFVISSNDFTFNAGATEHIVMAMVTTDTNQHGCGGGANFHDINIVADTAWAYYHNLPTSIEHAVHTLTANHPIRVYPNPAKDRLYIEHEANNTGGTITVFNTIGQRINVDINEKSGKYEVDIRLLPPGLYTVQYRNEERQGQVLFVKE